MLGQQQLKNTTKSINNNSITKTITGNATRAHTFDEKQKHALLFIKDREIQIIISMIA